MKCLICGNEDQQIKARDKHLVVTKSFADSHIHVHGDIEQKDLMKELLEVAEDELNITTKAHQGLNLKEIIFHNRQRIGDMFMYTCAVRDFKAAFPNIKVNVLSTAMHIWDNNPYIDKSIKPYYNNGKALETIVPADLLSGDTNVLKIGPGKLTNMSNRLDWHFANAFRVSIEDSLKINFQQGISRGDIWLTEEEYNAPRMFKEPYWPIIIGGEKGWGCKMYPFERWQEFVNQNKDVMFVQLGAANDNHPRLQGANIIDYVGKTEDKNTGLRDLLKIFLNAEGSIGLVSFHMHLSGALYKPALVIAGAREPVSFTRYHGHQYLANDGCLPCGINACWHCDINACKDLIDINGEKVPKCVDMIKPEDLTRALNQYYIGGRLKKGVVSEKPKQFKNIVKTQVAAPAVEIKKEPCACKSSDTLEFGNTCIEKEDWDVIKEVIGKYKVKTVLEFGCGLSTLKMAELGCKVIAYEVMPEWADKIRKINPNLDIRPWDGKEIPGYHALGQFDLVFCDGPASSYSGGAKRDDAIKMSSELGKVLIIHDAGRPGERSAQDKYVKDRFDGPVKGGRRCHTWVKKVAENATIPLISPETPPQATICPQTGNPTKHIKVVSTARGWGGCARSITTIMKLLLNNGHKVEFIPFRNKVASHEFQECIKNEMPDLKVTESYDTLNEQCDVIFVYGDDYIWDFGKPEISDVFSNINAGRKIMMLNYRRGSVGEIPWTKGWDKYMFLNSTQEKELLKHEPNAKTRVLAPCTDLTPFFKVQPDYNRCLRIVRHSSQGDVKFAKDFDSELNNVLNSRTDVQISMLPGPSFIQPSERFSKQPRTDKLEVIAEFLGTGNLFWYSLPQGYMDQGPRVIIEAMAAGLPVIADNWGGAIDRVTPECGWLCDTKEQMQEVIKNVTYEDLLNKGANARERAKEEFIVDNYIRELTDAS